MTDNRTRILEVAEILFAERGYTSTSTRDIVGGAGLKSPALYYHFGSKEGLLVELLEARLTRHCDELKAAIEEAEDTHAVFLRYASHEIHAMRDRPDTVRFTFGVLFGPQYGLPTDSIRQLQAKYQQVLVDALRRVDDTLPGYRIGFIAGLFLGMINSITLQFITSGFGDYPSELPDAIAVRAERMLRDDEPIPTNRR